MNLPKIQGHSWKPIKAHFYVSYEKSVKIYYTLLTVAENNLFITTSKIAENFQKRFLWPSARHEWVFVVARRAFESWSVKNENQGQFSVKNRLKIWFLSEKILNEKSLDGANLDKAAIIVVIFESLLIKSSDSDFH